MYMLYMGLIYDASYEYRIPSSFSISLEGSALAHLVRGPFAALLLVRDLLHSSRCEVTDILADNNLALLTRLRAGV